MLPQPANTLPQPSQRDLGVQANASASPGAGVSTPRGVSRPRGVNTPRCMELSQAGKLMGSCAGMQQDITHAEVIARRRASMFAGDSERDLHSAKEGPGRKTSKMEPGGTEMRGLSCASASSDRRTTLESRPGVEGRGASSQGAGTSASAGGLAGEDVGPNDSMTPTQPWLRGLAEGSVDEEGGGGGEVEARGGGGNGKAPAVAGAAAGPPGTIPFETDEILQRLQV